MSYAEQKKLEQKYGPAIAQFLCDEMDKTERMMEQQNTKKLINGFGDKTIIVKRAA